MQERTPRYINPYTDFGFKKLFGEDISAVLNEEVFLESFKKAGQTSIPQKETPMK